MDKKKVLIVDDEPYIRQLLRSVLETDCVVLEASDGKVAVRITHEEKPDLILMDILMPEMDGYNAFYEIRKDPTTSTIPVVMLTGMAFRPHKRLAKRMGADGYITKPFDLQDLVDKIKQYEPITNTSVYQAARGKRTARQACAERSTNKMHTQEV